LGSPTKSGANEKTIIQLVGGLEHEFYFPIQLGISSSQLTHIFQRGRYIAKQSIGIVSQMGAALRFCAQGESWHQNGGHVGMGCGMTESQDIDLESFR